MLTKYKCEILKHREPEEGCDFHLTSLSDLYFHAVSLQTESLMRVSKTKYEGSVQSTVLTRNPDHLLLRPLSTVVRYVIHQAISDSVVIILPQALGYSSAWHVLKNILSTPRD